MPRIARKTYTTAQRHTLSLAAAKTFLADTEGTYSAALTLAGPAKHPRTARVYLRAAAAPDADARARLVAELEEILSDLTARGLAPHTIYVDARPTLRKGSVAQPALHALDVELAPGDTIAAHTVLGLGSWDVWTGYARTWFDTGYHLATTDGVTLHGWTGHAFLTVLSRWLEDGRINHTEMYRGRVPHRVAQSLAA